MPEKSEPEIIEVKQERPGLGAEPVSKEHSLVVAQELLPESLLIVPAFERPLFPKMMGPLVIGNDAVKRQIAESSTRWGWPSRW